MKNLQIIYQRQLSQNAGFWYFLGLSFENSDGDKNEKQSFLKVKMTHQYIAALHTGEQSWMHYTVLH